MRFNWKNFKASKIDVVVKTKEEYNEFMKRCEKKGVKWASGPAATQLYYFRNRPLQIYVRHGRLHYAETIGRICNTPYIYYSEFALQAPADKPERGPILEATETIIAAINMVNDAITTARAAICDIMEQLEELRNKQLQELKKEQSDNE